jgi:hypothetical protein
VFTVHQQTSDALQTLLDEAKSVGAPIEVLPPLPADSKTMDHPILGSLLHATKSFWMNVDTRTLFL